VDLTSEIVPGEVVRILWANGSLANVSQQRLGTRGDDSSLVNVANSMFLRESRERNELFEATVTYPRDFQTFTLSGCV
jgi:hypothetical protein